MKNFNHFDKFTKEAKNALIVAQEKAKSAKLNYVGTEHILIGILAQENSLGASVLLSFGVSLDNVNLVLNTVGRSSVPAKSSDVAGLSGYAKEVIEEAVKIAHEFGHSFVGTEHLLFALVSQHNTAATVILENMKVSPLDIKEQIMEVFEKARQMPKNGEAVDPNMPKNSQMMNPVEFFLAGLQGVLTGQPKDNYKDGFKHKGKGKKADPNMKDDSGTPALDYFTTDLVEEVRNNKVDPIVGRTKEIERVISILSRKTKNNPVIIGESGVGKTAIVEGLAQAIATENVPENILDKRILSLSMSSIVAGTKYRGEFEERIKQIIDEATSQSNIILFIDELHTIMGAGSAEGSLDAANILKPALSRGKIQLIGSTTTSEYRKNIEKDAALERRFQSVMVEQPTLEETIRIIRGLRDEYEIHHKVTITDGAIEAAVRLSDRYVPDRFLPDKAIDAVDEAASMVHLRLSTYTPEIQELYRKIDDVIVDKAKWIEAQKFERALSLRNEEEELKTRLEGLKNEWRKSQGDVEPIVTEEDIARVISKTT
ncbi:ATP-dependent Clp protease ATP-binding subunit, partial [Patescibacteria group bacterium]|nr:ATP-dependent Clp protease ATP-binding subunit [Patescibacteria group bacterium]